MSSFPNLPQLPQLEGSLLLDVFTHSSLDYEGKVFNEDFGENSRLADIGEKVLNLAVTQRLFFKRPLLSVSEIAEHRNSHTSDETLDDWATAYQLKKNLKFAPDARDAIGTPEVSRFLVHSYIGAVYCQRGLVSIQSWIDRLVLPDEIPGPEPPTTPPRQISWGYPQPPTRPPPLPPRSPPNNTPSNLTPLAIFNQTLQQNGYGVEWPAESTGPPHALVWTVKCIVAGVERGQGVGRNQKAAREEAAKAASATMGWNSF
jgi:ribonuclease-3